MTEKGKILVKFNEAFASGDVTYIADQVTDDIEWTIMGDKTLTGKAAFIDALEKMTDGTPAKSEIEQVITHGKEAAVRGAIIMESDKVRRFAFCDTYVFSGFKNPKIKQMVSFVQEVS
ncbi:nuclear transport factor 2 family protein [Echinicola soli]|uniref:Nuclear transport factor 2 family protein n=1 Tax=Echinicola soli TaxID=2591634 RepID=A0A514CGH1_9BACT|nr:nuclear transport factor 2 family protein [Echinicola soli]QDH78754.1 nuclear transport factor 2 family protein [Echinicola soli]